MSKLIVPRRSLLLGGAAVALAPASAFAASPDLGKPAPLFTAVDSNGKTWSLADLKGKVVVLETTNHDCPYVRKHYNAKQHADPAARGRGQGRGVADRRPRRRPASRAIVTAAQANELTKSRDAAPAAVLLDPQSKIARAYGATVTPHMYIIDATGMLVYKGGIDSIPSSSVADIPKATQYVRVGARRGAGRQAGQPRPRPAPYGCTLKYRAPRPEDRAMPHDGWHPHDHDAHGHPHHHHDHRASRHGGSCLPPRPSCRSAAPARRPSTPPSASPTQANRFLGRPRRRRSASRR